MRIKIYILVLILFTIGLFLMPVLLWGNLYTVGGDDAKLYYLYPLQYLVRQSFNVISHNTLGGNLGYFPVSYTAPTIAFLALLKLRMPTVNTQFTAYGIIFSLGFLFMYLFLRELVPDKRNIYVWGGIAASLYFILSAYVTKTYFQHQIISIFLLMVVPVCLYLLVKGMKRKQYAYYIASALFYSIFSSTVYSFPWLFPTVITLIPFVLYLVIKYGKEFWKSVGIFVLVSFFVNFYWIIHYIIPVVTASGASPVTGQLLSSTFVNQNHDLIAALTNLNSPVRQITSTIRTGWDQRRGITFAESLGSIYLLLIVSAGALLNKVRKETRILYIVSISGLAISMLFVTPNFGQWNLQLFQFLNDHVPFFGMVRTMYDKFALGMLINFSLALYMSFVVISEAKTKAAIRFMAVGIIISLTLINALPYIHPVYRDDLYSTRISGVMNKDFLDLTKYLSAMPTTSRFLWLPMTFPGYVYISDALYPNHFYSGLSPLQLLSGKSDVAGFYGISTPADPELNWRILDLLKNRSYQDIGQILGYQNIGYIIVNHDVIPPEGEGFKFMKLQTHEFQKTLLGEKIRDFGKRYSLYAINDAFGKPTIFLESGGSVVYSQNKDGVYDVSLQTDKATSLVLLEPFSQLWNVRVVTGSAAISYHPVLAYGYGNTWTVAATTEAHIQLYFWPNGFILPSIVVSAVAAGLAGVLCVVGILRKKS